MDWWLTALGYVLWQDLQPSVFLIFGAVIGATLGSIRRWYASRWQIGFVAGIGSAMLLFVLIARSPALIHGLHNRLILLTVRYSRPALILFNGDYPAFVGLLLAIQAAAGSLLTSIVLSHWIHYSTISSRVIAFRQRPWAWWNARIAVPLIVIIGVLSGWAWYATHVTAIVWREKVLRCAHEFPRLKQQLEPFGVSVKNDGRDSLSVDLEALPTVPDSALDALAATQCPIEVYLLSGRIQDGDLVRLAGSLTAARYIYLRCSQVTDAGLLGLTQCPKVKHISIIDCDSVTREGIDRFHEARPEVKINADNGKDVVKYSP